MNRLFILNNGVGTFLLRSKKYRQFFALALTVACLGNVMAAGHAYATIYYIDGETYIAGTDRSNGVTYASSDEKKLLPVYAGDTVTFSGRACNRGAMPKWSNVWISNRYFDGTSSNGTAAKPYAFGPQGHNFGMGGAGLLAILPAGCKPLIGPDSTVRYTTPSVTIGGPGSTTPGNKFCQFVKVNPHFADPILDPLGFFSVGNRSFDRGNEMACAEIAYVYNLIPTVTFNNKGAFSGSASITPKVTQGTLPTGAPGATDSLSTEWQVTRIVYTSGNEPTGGTSNRNPCDKFRADNSTITCTPVLQSGTGSNRKNTIFKPNGDIKSGTAYPTTDSVGSLPAGSIVCYALSVNAFSPYIAGSTTWRHSSLDCLPRVVDRKSPKVQILGDDVRVGGRIETLQASPQNDPTRLFGSWGEYASYSVGKTNGFGSSSGLKDGIARTAPRDEWSTLTYANTQADFGEFSASVQSRGATDIKPFFTQGSTQSGIGGSVNLASLSGRKTPYRIDNGSTPLEIIGDTIPKGKTLIIVASGAVEIKSDIKYTTDTLVSLREIPQVLIIAESVSIAEGVKQVDAWVIANSQSGTINTCSPRQSPGQRLTTSICSEQLRVNGPVVTNKLLLHRTAGSTDGDPGAPAEVFSNSGDSYLWALNYSRSLSTMTTTYQTELPPRY